jgi:hypothetical protein
VRLLRERHLDLRRQRLSEVLSILANAACEHVQDYRLDLRTANAHDSIIPPLHITRPGLVTVPA